MKTVFKLILLLMIMGISGGASAKSPDVKLVVTSDGATKDDAVKNALRSAIEQTYGVFVSANTDILNDDIVRDEIATVSSGNIKSYKELSCTEHDGKTNVTLEAVVSVGKLISYAKSKGAECEFDGASMFADLQLQELYKKNEETTIENVVRQLAEMFKTGYDYELKINKAKSEYTGYFQDDYGYTHYGSYSPDNGNPDDVCLQYNIKIKLNKNGADAWKSLEDNLKLIGKEMSVPKMITPSSIKKLEQLAEQYPAQFMIPTADTSYGAQGKIFGLRSEKSVAMIGVLLAQLPDLISNVSLDCGGEFYDITDGMQFVDENTQPAAQSYLIEKRAMHKKEGQNCGEYQGFINLPLSAIKKLKTIKVVQNGDLELLEL